MADPVNKDTGESKPRKMKYRKAKASWNPAMQAIPVSGIRRLVNMLFLVSHLLSYILTSLASHIFDHF